jgi:hypothetical protein
VGGPVSTMTRCSRSRSSSADRRVPRDPARPPPAQIGGAEGTGGPGTRRKAAFVPCVRSYYRKAGEIPAQQAAAWFYCSARILHGFSREMRGSRSARSNLRRQLSIPVRSLVAWIRCRNFRDSDNVSARGSTWSAHCSRSDQEFLLHRVIPQAAVRARHTPLVAARDQPARRRTFASCGTAEGVGWRRV